MRRQTVSAVAVAALAVAGCGTGDQQGGVARDGPPSRIALTVEVTGTGPDSSRWELLCKPVGGDHPRAKAACATLTKGSPELFSPVDKNMQCTMIYGGPQEATVTGHWGERQIDATFSRTNGCEIARWDALVPLLPKV